MERPSASKVTVVPRQFSVVRRKPASGRVTAEHRPLKSVLAARSHRLVLPFFAALVGLPGECSLRRRSPDQFV